MLGKNFSFFNDNLLDISCIDIYNSLISENYKLESIINQLNIVRQINENKYENILKKLPYIVFGDFSPSIRDVSNFASAKYIGFNIEVEDLDVNILKANIIKDEEICLLFNDASSRGLNVIVELDEICYDINLYSLLVKKYIKSFSLKYNLDINIYKNDNIACVPMFVSLDSTAYYNENNLKVVLKSYVDIENPNELMYDKKKIDRDSIIKKKNLEQEPVPEVLNSIKRILNPSSAVKIRKKSLAYVPEILNDLTPYIIEYFKSISILVSEVSDINYGKKLVLIQGGNAADINLFYGKKGFSIVKSPKKGTNDQFADKVVVLLRDFIDLYSE